MADRKEAERLRLRFGCGSKVGMPVALVVVVQVLVDIRRRRLADTPPFLDDVEFLCECIEVIFTLASNSERYLTRPNLIRVMRPTISFKSYTRSVPNIYIYYSAPRREYTIFVLKNN